jgi:hypothetical protein
VSNEESLALFKDIKVIGEYTPERVASKLQQMGDPDTANKFMELANTSQAEEGLFGSRPLQPWEHTAHQYGYIPLRSSEATALQPIQSASAIEPDKTLKNSRINIRIDRLRIYKYPGGGMHNVMLTFAARNQVSDTLAESVSFSQTYRVQEGQLAGIAGYPVFIGLNVGMQGVAFECSTVNVKNDADEALLQALESKPFQNGLNLLTTLQPAIAPFTEITLGVVKMLAARNQNVAVQKFYLGLDFEQAALGVRLAQGNYIAVQVPNETTIDWSRWVFNQNTGAIVHKANSEPLDYNYVVFRISRYEE